MNKDNSAETGELVARVKLIRELPEDDYHQMRDALEFARGWMAHNAGGDDWANNVRIKLNEALRI